MHTLVIDTSFGSTVGVVGHDPVVEHDSRTHVEKLRNDIDAACRQAGVAPHEAERIVVGVGPAPFTGLRAGIVTAKAIAYATGATLLGQDDLTPNAVLMHYAHRHDPRFADRFDYADVSVVTDGTPRVALTLSVNDARRRQLYFGLYAGLDAGTGDPTTLIDMDIDAPDHIARRVGEAVDRYRDAHPGVDVVLDVVGHGARKYASAWDGLARLETVSDIGALDMGAAGLALFADVAQAHATADEGTGAVEPLYLRRPDVSVPNPLKHVLNHDPAHGTGDGAATA